MELLTKELRHRLPKLYATEQQGLKAKALVHYFSPGSHWDWYASEFDGQDTFFGLVRGFEIELGYFSLSELESLRIPVNIVNQATQEALGSYAYRIERDLYWTPKSLQAIWDELAAGIHP